MTSWEVVKPAKGSPLPPPARDNVIVYLITFIAFIAAACPGPPWLPSHSNWSSGAGQLSEGGMSKRTFPSHTGPRLLPSYSILVTQTPLQLPLLSCCLPGLLLFYCRRGCPLSPLLGPALLQKLLALLLLRQLRRRVRLAAACSAAARCVAVCPVAACSVAG